MSNRAPHKSLYDLNKDELIYLISIIQEETRKQLKKEIEDECKLKLFTILEKRDIWVEKSKCEKCDKYRYVETSSQTILENTDLKFYRCWACDKYYCEEHLEGNMTQGYNIWICNDPTDHYD